MTTSPTSAFAASVYALSEKALSDLGLPTALAPEAPVIVQLGLMGQTPFGLWSATPPKSSGLIDRHSLGLIKAAELAQRCQMPLITRFNVQITICPEPDGSGTLSSKVRHHQNIWTLTEMEDRVQQRAIPHRQILSAGMVWETPSVCLARLNSARTPQSEFKSPDEIMAIVRQMCGASSRHTTRP